MKKLKEKEVKDKITESEGKHQKDVISKILNKAVRDKKQDSSVLKKSMSQFAVIGLGRFGMTVALTLANEGNDVLAIDINERNIHQIENYVAGTAVADATGEGVLKQLGIKNFDCVVISIG